MGPASVYIVGSHLDRSIGRPIAKKPKTIEMCRFYRDELLERRGYAVKETRSALCASTESGTR